jgi:hypothetical protein
MPELRILQMFDEHCGLLKTSIEDLDRRRCSPEKQRALDAIKKTKRMLSEMEKQMKLLEVVEEE